MALTSCENEEMNEGIEKNDTFTVNFVTDAPESRTSVVISEGAANFAWGATGEEKFQFAQIAEGAEALTLGTNVQFTNNAGKGEISATFTGDATTKYNFTAVYPANAWVENTNTNFKGVKVIFNNSQDLIAGTFDPNADLLVSKMKTGTLEEVSAVAQQLQFTRLVSIAEMNLKLLHVSEGEKITSVTFEVSDSTPALAGRAYLDLESGQITEYDYNDNKYNSITISDLNGIEANNESVKVYFTCMPTTIAVDTEYTITVITNKAVYTKSNTLSKELTFEVGKVKAFGVDMKEATVEAGNAFTIPWEENFGADFDASKYTLKNGGSDTKVYPDDKLAGGEAGEILIGKEGGSFSATFASDGTAKTLNLWFKSNKDFIEVSSATEDVTITKLTSTGYTVALAEGVKMFSLTLTNNNGSNARVDDIVLTTEAPAIASLAIANQTISFTEDDEFVFDGTVTAVYENGITESVETGYTVDDSAVDMTKAGNYDVTISYSGVSASYTIIVTSASVQTKTFTLSNQGTLANSVITWSQDGVTIVQAKGTGSSAPSASYTSATNARIYQGNTLTFSSNNNITKIEITASGDYYGKTASVNVGTLNNPKSSGCTLTWTGSEKEVILTNGIGSGGSVIRATKIVITYEVGGNGGGTESEPQDQTLSFPEASYKATIGEDFVEPTLVGAQTAVTYASSDEEIATVDAETGDITLLRAGFTTITATAEATAEYNSATAEYTLTVNEPENPVTPPADGEEQTYTVDNFNNELGFDDATGNVTDSQAYALGSDLTLTGYKNGNSNAPGVNKDGSLRLYTNNYIEIASEKTITKIEFTFSTGYTGNITATPATYSNGTWTGSANSVTFKNTSQTQARIKTMTITYAN